MRNPDEFVSSELEDALKEAMRNLSIVDRNDILQHPEVHTNDSPVIARARAIRRRIVEEKGFH